MRSERRTGAAVLSLVLATNCAAWTQFVATFEAMTDEPVGLLARSAWPQAPACWRWRP